MENKQKEVKQFIADRYITKWLKDNKEFLDDYRELCVELLMFKAKWGIEIGFIFKNLTEVKGRELGIGFVEELFNEHPHT